MTILILFSLYSPFQSIVSDLFRLIHNSKLELSLGEFDIHTCNPSFKIINLPLDLTQQTAFSHQIVPFHWLHIQTTQHYRVGTTHLLCKPQSCAHCFCSVGINSRDSTCLNKVDRTLFFLINKEILSFLPSKTLFPL